MTGTAMAVDRAAFDCTALVVPMSAPETTADD